MKAGPRRGTPAKLVTASSGSLPMAISRLVRDPSYQVRQRVDEATVARYANILAEGVAMPPIRVASVNGVLVLVDGWHRVAAHDRRGLREIEAEVIKATASEAQWMAAAANLSHGLPLRRAEIRTAFQALIRARQHIPKPGSLLTYRELAGKLGGLVRHTTVHN